MHFQNTRIQLAYCNAYLNYNLTKNDTLKQAP